MIFPMGVTFELGSQFKWMIMKSERQYIFYYNIRALMSEQLAASLFDESTSMYSEGNYPVCLALLNDCILLEPTLSILYSNRAISNFSLKEIDSALADLQKSIEINHLNYVAYFNLFSLNFLQSKSEDAFKNLCFSLSSIYTVLSRHAKNIDWIDQAIFYSCNNKQAIFLKAMDQLQNNRHQDALGLLKEVVELERVEENRNGIHSIINFIEKTNGLEVSPFRPSMQEKTSFKLMTRVPVPSQDQFDPTLEEMLKEFNQMNKLIHEYEQQSIRQLNPSTQKSIENSQKMEKQTNCKTIFESNLQRSEDCIKEEKNNQDQSCFSRQGRIDKLNLYSSISEGTNEEDEEIRTKVSSYDLYPINQQDKLVSIYIEQAMLYSPAEIGSDINNLYGVFHYSSGDSQVTLRTAQINIKEGLCRWAEWSQDIQLSHVASSLRFTIFSKNFTSFDDKVIGTGQFLLDSVGYVNTQFFDSARQAVGKVDLIIERAS